MEPWSTITIFIVDVESNPCQVGCNVIPLGSSCSDASYILVMTTLHPTALTEPEASKYANWYSHINVVCVWLITRGATTPHPREQTLRMYFIVFTKRTLVVCLFMSETLFRYCMNVSFVLNLVLFYIVPRGLCTHGDLHILVGRTSSNAMFYVWLDFHPLAHLPPCV